MEFNLDAIEIKIKGVGVIIPAEKQEEVTSSGDSSSVEISESGVQSKTQV